MSEGAAMFIAIAILGVMFGGEPDLSDALIAHLSGDCEVLVPDGEDEL